MSYQAMPQEQKFDPFSRFTPQSYELIPLDTPAPTGARSDTAASRPKKLTRAWRSLWRTPATMGSLFLSALVFALLHLGLFLYLDGKRADGPKSISQSYVAALSHLFGLLFRATLSASLLVAFTQYLWQLMRQKAMKISSIETLFKITQNPFLLLQLEVVKVAPILFVLATFTWVLPLAVTFPPGALIVVSSPVQNSSSMTIPTYNGSSMGNGTTADATLHATAIRYLSGGTWIYLGPTPIVRRLGRLVLELDSITPAVSPCGSNCTYSTQFDGPYVQCKKHILNQTVVNVGTLGCGYNAFSATNLSASADALSSSSPYGISGYGEDFNMSTSRAIYPPSSKSSSHQIQEIETLTCTPSWATYKVNVTYNNGVHTVTRSQQYMGTIRDMIQPLDRYLPNNKGVWPEGLVDYLTGLNHFALLDAVMGPLSGNYTMLQSGAFYGGSSSALSCGPEGGTIVADTHLNTQRENSSRTAIDGPNFSVSEDILNDALFNLTMSASFQLGFWETKVTGRTSTLHQFYSFASLQTFLIPYLSCLVLSIPFVFLGLSSLRANGASAIEGGFVQVLMTTTGSKALQKAAADGCLGGEENTPEMLKNMKIRFGELVSNGVNGDGNAGQVRRAGFGIEDEVIPLKRGIQYGL